MDRNYISFQELIDRKIVLPYEFILLSCSEIVRVYTKLGDPIIIQSSSFPPLTMDVILENDNDTEEKEYIYGLTPDDIFIPVKEVETISKEIVSNLECYHKFRNSTLNNNSTKILQQHPPERERQLADTQSMPEAYASFFASFPILHEIFKLHCEGMKRNDIATAMQEAKKATALQAMWLTKDNAAYSSDGSLKQALKRWKAKYKLGTE